MAIDPGNVRKRIDAVLAQYEGRSLEEMTTAARAEFAAALAERGTSAVALIVAASVARSFWLK
jgi:hypothetical protein